VTDKTGPGQRDKRAAEERTAQVAADNQATETQQRTDEESREAEARRHEELDKSDSAAEKIGRDYEHGDTDDVTGAVRLNPFPAYEDRDVKDLRSLAESRGVEINRDVEKAHLVKKLRAKQPTNPSWDFMTLEDLRSAAGEHKVELDPEFEKAHLVTELRAADTGSTPTRLVQRSAR
jgi:hypothetical protein